jgi:hypothetical protein
MDPNTVGVLTMVGVWVMVVVLIAAVVSRRL